MDLTNYSTPDNPYFKFKFGMINVYETRTIFGKKVTAISDKNVDADGGDSVSSKSTGRKRTAAPQSKKPKTLKKAKKESDSDVSAEKADLSNTADTTDPTENNTRNDISANDEDPIDDSIENDGGGNIKTNKTVPENEKAMRQTNIHDLSIRDVKPLNLCMLDEKNKPIQFKTVHDIMQWFCQWRLPYYNKRKENMIAILQTKINDLQKLVTFIEKIKSMDGIDIFSDSPAVLRQKLTSCGFPLEFMHKQMSSLNIEQLEKYRSEIAALVLEQSVLSTKTSLELWEQDLTDFELAYKPWNLLLYIDFCSKIRPEFESGPIYSCPLAPNVVITQSKFARIVIKNFGEKKTKKSPAPLNELEFGNIQYDAAAHIYCSKQADYELKISVQDSVMTLSVSKNQCDFLVITHTLLYRL